jgi:3-oxoacyl-[acyl-carrier-protein] synthase II
MARAWPEEESVARVRVVVTGMGCVSPLGNNLETTWRALLAGTSGVGPITQFDASSFKTKFAAEVKGFDPDALLGRREARRMDRFTQFAIVAVGEALTQAGLSVTDANRGRIGVLLGTGIGGIGTLLRGAQVLAERGPHWVSPFLIPMMLPDTGASQVAIQFGLRGPNLAVVTACATGTNAIGEAAQIIRRGDADVMVAGGSEAAIVPVALAGFNVMDAISTRNDEPERASRPFDRDRDGFVLGEGAAVLVLESLGHARSRHAQILAEVTGYGTTNDAYHMSAPLEDGAGASACMRLAMADAGLEPSEIDYINAHGTSTKLNDASETSAIKSVFGEQAYNIPVSSTKSMTGHLLGAAGAIEAIFCILALRDDILPPTINYQTPDPACDLDYVPNRSRPAKLRHTLSNSFGFGGHNASVILSQPPTNGDR